MARSAAWSRAVRKRGEIIANWLDARLSGIAAFGEVAVESQVDGVDVVGAGLRFGIGDDRARRCRGSALPVAPKDGVAETEHDVVGAGAAHHGLVKIVAHGKLVGETLQNRSIAGLHVVEGHRVSAAIVVDCAAAKWVRNVRVRDKRIQIVQATGRIVARRVADIAVRLLPHFKEAVSSVAGEGIIRKVGSFQRERFVRKSVEVGHARVRVRLDKRLGKAGCCAGRKQIYVADFQRRFDRREKRSWSSRREDCGGRGKIQRRLRENVVRRFFRILQADEELHLERRDSPKLLRPSEVRAGSSVFVDDSLGQQVVYKFTFLRLVCSEHMIERAIFADQYNHMLNRSSRALGFPLLRLRGTGEHST